MPKHSADLPIPAERPTFADIINKRIVMVDNNMLGFEDGSEVFLYTSKQVIILSDEQVEDIPKAYNLDRLNNEKICILSLQ